MNANVLACKCIEHVPKEIGKLFSKLVPKIIFMGSLLWIFMPHFQYVGSMFPICAGNMLPTKVQEVSYL